MLHCWGDYLERRKDGLDMYTLHLFAGAGGGIAADLLLGHTPIGAVEIETYPRKVLMQRQLDGILPVFPVWDDVKTFREDNPETDGFISRLKGIRDNLAICGGFPCTDLSSARTNSSTNGEQRGLDGESSGLWSEMARIIDEIRPRRAFLENSPNLIRNGLDRVLVDLAVLGYDAQWCRLSAGNIGAPHVRDRVWIMADSNESQRKGGSIPSRVHKEHTDAFSTSWWETEPKMDRVVDVLADRLGQLKAIGNGQSAPVAALAWKILTKE